MDARRDIFASCIADAASMLHTVRRNIAERGEETTQTARAHHLQGDGRATWERWGERLALASNGAGQLQRRGCIWRYRSDRGYLASRKLSWSMKRAA
jgi:hypothetical protein